MSKLSQLCGIWVNRLESNRYNTLLQFSFAISQLIFAFCGIHIVKENSKRRKQEKSESVVRTALILFNLAYLCFL